MLFEIFMENLKLIGISLYLSAFINLCFVALFWQRMKGNKARLHMGFIAFFSALYSIAFGTEFFFWETFDHKLRLLCDRSSWLGIMILPPFVVFSNYFIENFKNINLKISFFYLTGTTITVLSLFSPLVIKDLKPGAIPPLSSTELIKGELEPLARFYILFCLAYCLFLLFRYYFKATGIKRAQTKYFILGTVIYALSGVINTSLSYLLGNPRYEAPFIPCYFSVIWLIFTAYAIFKQRLMDIKVAIGRTAVYLFSTITLTAIAFLIIFFYSKIGSPFPFNLVLILVLTIVCLSFQPIFNFFEKIAGR